MLISLEIASDGYLGGLNSLEVAVRGLLSTEAAVVSPGISPFVFTPEVQDGFQPSFPDNVYVPTEIDPPSLPVPVEQIFFEEPRICEATAASNVFRPVEIDSDPLPAQSETVFFNEPRRTKPSRSRVFKPSED